MFERIERADGTVVGLSLLFLFWVALLPFPTAVLGDHGDTPAGVILYAATIILTGLSSTVLWWYAAVGRPRLRDGARPLIRQDLDPDIIQRSLAGGTAVVTGFIPSIPLAFVDPAAAELSWLLVIPMGHLLDRAAQRRAARAGGRSGATGRHSDPAPAAARTPPRADARVPPAEARGPPPTPAAASRGHMAGPRCARTRRLEPAD